MTQTKNNDAILEIFIVNKCDPCLIEWWIEIKDLFNENYKKRIYEWILFFDNIDDSKTEYNDYQTRSLFNDTVNAIFQLSLDEEWFSQTNHEFNISKKFYHLVFTSGNLTHFQDENDVFYFLKTSIVYSYFYGLIKVPIIEASKVLLPYPNIENQSIFFRTLFSSYSNSCDLILYKNFLYMNFNDMKIFIKIINGKSIRKIKEMPLQYSKKQADIMLHRIPRFLKMKCGVFKEGWYLSKLLSINSDEQFFLDFYHGLRLDHKINIFFIRDFVYWKEVYLFLTQNEPQINTYNRYGLGHISIRDILDYLTYKKYTELKVVHIKKRSLLKLCGIVQDWDFFSHKNISKPNKTISWQNESIEVWVFDLANIKYQINEISDSDMLYHEAVTLKHCVYLYLNDCISKRIRIFSLKTFCKSNYKHSITIELKDKQIIQARGKYNRIAIKEELIILNEWATNFGYKMLA
ncbi:PcfJ domain-containing protein [Polaribacter haliotis]|uniref:PcfJ domain-containing protein n=2 Tax=Polaribacter TaxID=52959 RepID=A0A7L8AG63_9FLAO|nr:MULTISPECIES: PcfJ domain-containing protein [Polaribacter]MDD7914119.1 PcfJ domain-containing protein [Polaribacter sp. MSW5]QOD61005.1 PcfJ domain-containing protein [Polaribacter haliotis]